MSNQVSHDSDGRKVEKTIGTVVVACKLPHGIVIRDHVATTALENTPAGARSITVFRPVGPKIRIKGPTVPTEFIRMVEVVGGYALSYGIPADVFERWMEWSKDSTMVRNNMIFGHEKRERVIDWAKEHASQKSGLEPLDVSMKSENGQKVHRDERIRHAGAGQVVDGSIDLSAA